MLAIVALSWPERTPKTALILFTSAIQSMVECFENPARCKKIENIFSG
jgi:hypothetical protein